MNLSGQFIRRPVATSLLAIAVMLAGLLGYRSLPISALPQIDFPTIQVTTELPGADAQTVSRLVTAPLEHQLGEIQSLTDMTSTSSMGLSRITLQFALNRNIDAAAQDVQSAINSAKSALPDKLPYPPTYAKVNPANAPILTLALTSTSLPIERLSDLADTLLAQRLSEVSGVGNVTVEGGIKPAVRIQANLPQLAAYGIGLETLRSAINNANVNGSKGSLNGALKAFTIGANDQLADAAAYRSVVVAYSNGAPVQLRDVAKVVSGVENNRVAAAYNGQPAVILDVQRQPGANTVQTIARLNARLPQLRQAMPSGVNLHIASDRTTTIRASVHDVQLTLMLSVGLVVLVVLLFLRAVSATVIAGVALSLSLIGTFALMWLCGFSLDNLSLMALTIGTGFVIDDAIVMIENITRHLENGDPPLLAAYKGAGEIAFTVVSLTLSLIAVFIPLLFMSGIIGRLFREFALTLTLAVLTSAAVSLTLTPMMCSRLMRRGATGIPNRWGKYATRVIDQVSCGYERSLNWALDRRLGVLAVTLTMLALTIWLYLVIPKGFLPQQDTGLITASSEARQSISFDALKKLQARVAGAVRRDPDVDNVVWNVGVGANNSTPNAGHMTITLRPRVERSDDLAATLDRLRSATASIPGINVLFKPVQDMQIATTSGRAQYQYVLVDSDAPRLAKWATRLAQKLKTLPQLRDVSSNLQDQGQHVQISVDRMAAARLGVTMRSIDNTLYDAFGQRQISTMYDQANQYRVVLEAAPRFQADPNQLATLFVPTDGGMQVPLKAVATIRRTTSPLAVHRVEQFPAVTLSFDLAPGVSLSQAVARVKQAQRVIHMPSSINGRFVGAAAEFKTSLRNEPWLILAAVVVIYIVLGVLYESVIHPFTILTTLPSAGVGALLALAIGGFDLSVVALIGIILLMGIVKKNAIMMIDFALEAERAERLAPREAIFKACLLRFRPIMMTTIAALLGALPLALGSGTGSELRVPLGVTIIGGLVLSQFLTLYTTPVIYLLMDSLRDRVMGSRLARRLIRPGARRGLAEPSAD